MMKAPGAVAAAAGKVYPADAASFLLTTGIAPQAIYLFNEASGALDDKVGTADLVAGGSPTFNYDMAGDRNGVHYDGSGDKHSADVHALGTGSGIYGVVFDMATNPGSSTSNIVGRINATLADGVALRIVNTGNVPSVLCRDGGSTASVGVNFTMDIRTGGPMLATIQVDRSANVVRARITKANGTFEQVTTASIASFGTLDGASQEFGFGGIFGHVYGAACAYGFVITGASAAGANVLAGLHDTLGWE